MSKHSLNIEPIVYFNYLKFRLNKLSERRGGYTDNFFRMTFPHLNYNVQKYLSVFHIKCLFLYILFFFFLKNQLFTKKTLHRISIILFTF